MRIPHTPRFKILCHVHTPYRLKLVSVHCGGTFGVTYMDVGEEELSVILDLYKPDFGIF